VHLTPSFTIPPGSYGLIIAPTAFLSPLPAFRLLRHIRL
jgi:hypothetical protein